VQVSGKECRIVEIKPNNDAAVNKGWDPVKDYAAPRDLASWRQRSNAHPLSM